MKLGRLFICAIISLTAAIACSKDEETGPVYLEVNKNNISGKW